MGGTLRGAILATVTIITLALARRNITFMATTVVWAKFYAFVRLLVRAFEVFGGVTLETFIRHARIASSVVGSTIDCETGVCQKRRREKRGRHGGTDDGKSLLQLQPPKPSLQRHFPVFISHAPFMPLQPSPAFLLSLIRQSASSQYIFWVPMSKSDHSHDAYPSYPGA